MTLNYLLVMPVGMLLAIFLLYKITNKIGFRLKLSSLLLCLVLSIAVTFVGIKTSTTLSKEYALHLFLAAIAAALLVSLCEFYFAGRQAKSQALPVSEKPAETGKDTAAPQSTAVQAADTKEEKTPLTETKPQTSPAAPQEKMAAEQLPQEKPAVAKDAEKEIQQKRKEALAEAAQKLSQAKSLDDILDYAYAQKNKHNYDVAIIAYNKALQEYNSDSYAPFIAVDLINIYKIQGLYSEAIDCCEAAFSLPAIASSTAMHDEISKALVYLRVVKYILDKHHASRTPFTSIPAEIMQEIEDDFQNRWSQGESKL